MKIPKIIFKYSGAYNRFHKEWLKAYASEEFKSHNRKFSSAEKELKVLDNYKRRVCTVWNNHEKDILQELSEISSLNWEEEIIECYIVYVGMTISNPLTMHTFKEDSDFVDFLTHEMIHRLFMEPENLKRTKTAWKYIDRKYRNESEKTRLHIPIQALHNHIFLKFFNKERLERHIKKFNYFPDISRAWQIVQKEGYQNILREFTKRIR